MNYESESSYKRFWDEWDSNESVETIVPTRPERHQGFCQSSADATKVKEITS